MFIKERPKIFQYDNKLLLIWMNGEIKNVIHQIDKTCDNNNLSNVCDLDYLVNPISDSE